MSLPQNELSERPPRLLKKTIGKLFQSLYISLPQKNGAREPHSTSETIGNLFKIFLHVSTTKEQSGRPPKLVGNHRRALPEIFTCLYHKRAERKSSTASRNHRKLFHDIATETQTKQKTWTSKAPTKPQSNIATLICILDKLLATEPQTPQTSSPQRHSKSN